MSFHPLQGGFQSSLLGVGTTNKVLDIDREDREDLYEKRVHGSKDNNTIVIIIISAILFVTIIAIYDVLRNVINNHYAKIALTDPKAENTQQDINSTLVANTQGLIASIVFAIICIIIAVITVVWYLYYRRVT